MTKESYTSCMSRIQAFPGGVLLLQILVKALTYGTGVFYVWFLLTLFLMQWHSLLVAGILVPMVSFVGVSLFRQKYNAQRPYERFDFTPLIPKETKGKSFPSRHVFSIYVIGGTIFWVYPKVGVWIFLGGLILAVLRVVVGIHFPKDVIAGGIAGFLCSLGMKIAVILLV